MPMVLKKKKRTWACRVLAMVRWPGLLEALYYFSQVAISYFCVVAERLRSSSQNMRQGIPERRFKFSFLQTKSAFLKCNLQNSPPLGSTMTLPHVIYTMIPQKLGPGEIRCCPKWQKCLASVRVLTSCLFSNTLSIKKGLRIYKQNGKYFGIIASVV